MAFNDMMNALRGLRGRAERVDGAEAHVFVNDIAHPVLDWSESGFRVEAFQDAPAKGDRFAFRFELPLTSEDIFEFNAWAEVASSGPRGLAARYLHLDPEVAARIHEVLRVLATMDVTVPSGPITYD